MLGLGNKLQKTGLKKIYPGVATGGLVLKSDFGNREAVPISDGSASFDGTDDYVTFGNDSSTQITGAISISLWMKSSDTSAIQYLVAKDDNTNRNFWLATESITGKAWFTFYNSGSNKQVKSTNHNVCDGNWNHIVAIFNTSTEKSAIYVNGELSAESLDHNVTTIDNDTVNLELGRRGNGVYYYDGNICNVGIWSAALTAAQIKSIMYKNYAGLNTSEKTNLVSWWNLSAVSIGGSTVVDNHGSNNGTLS